MAVLQLAGIWVVLLPLGIAQIRNRDRVFVLYLCTVVGVVGDGDGREKRAVRFVWRWLGLTVVERLLQLPADIAFSPPLGRLGVILVGLFLFWDNG